MTTKLLTYPLIIMMFVSALTIMQFAFISATTQIHQEGAVDVPKSKETDAFSQVFNWTTILALLISFIGIGVSSGISILGSGLSTFAQAVIYKSLLFYALWGIFSAIGLRFFAQISTIGIAIWFILSLLYMVGVQEQIGTSPTK